jgi:hypothetical protein
MRNKQHLTREIVELNAIKASYNHYLASGRSIFEVENTTQLHYNLCVINRSLRDLFAELKGINEQMTVNHQPMTGKILTDYFKQLETYAIMQFNSDRRFTITE